MKKEDSICESCGNVGEIGYIISEGDEVATILISGADYQSMTDKLREYLDIAQSINKSVSYEKVFDEQAMTLSARLIFEVSAEKLIFELKTRHLNQ